MEQKLLSEGIDAIIEFCKANRTLETTQKHQLACDTIRNIYELHSDTDLNPNLNSQIRHEVKKEINIMISTRRYYSERYVFRVLGMLDDFYVGMPFKEKYPVQDRYKHKLSPYYEIWAEEFKKSLQVEKSTIPGLYSVARDFFHYLEQQEILDFSNIVQSTIYDFIQYEYPNHKGSMKGVVYVSRLLCKFLNDMGYDAFSSELFPFALPPSRRKVFPSFERSDMEKILKAPDTNTSVGKRDFAVLMLASVTGMRAIDIANLMLSDINWNEMSFHFIQHKTKFGLSLPLDNIAASAVADYILNGRPKVENPYVFLTNLSPYRKLSDKSSVANILNKYTKLSGIEKNAHDGKSFHAFRRSMGAWLLDTESAPEMISQILGHHSRDVLQRYLPIKPTALEICAIDFSDIIVQSEVYK